MSRSSRRYCAVESCRRRNFDLPKVSFFRFPKDKTRCKQWVVNCGRKDFLNKDSVYLYENHVLCANHFDEKMFVDTRRKRLVKNAIPILIETSDLSQVSSRRRKPILHRSVLKVGAQAKPANDIARNKSKQSDDVNQQLASDLDEDGLVTQVQISDALVSSVAQSSTIALVSSLQPATTTPHQVVVLPSINNETNSGVNVFKFRKILPCVADNSVSNSSTQPITLPVMIFENQQQVDSKSDDHNKKIVSKDDALNILRSELTEGEYILLKSMLKTSSQDYSDEEKCFFTLFYLHGPKAYEYLRQRQINIPNPSMLRSWMDLVGYNSD